MSENEKHEANAQLEHVPLFTGDGSRDLSVSEFEKAAEVSFAIREVIDRLKGRGRDK